MAAAAIAAAAKKRAEKLGLQNQEVDETNVGGADPQLAHPFFGKLKQSGNEGGLSPRSKRLKELEDKEGGKENKEPAKTAAPQPPPAPAAPAAPPAPAPAPAAPPAPPPAAPAGAPEKKIDTNMGFSDENAANLLSTASQGTKAQQTDAVAVVKRWSSIESIKLEMAENSDVFQVLADISMGPHEQPREESIALLRALCGDEKVFGMLLGTGAAFGPLQQMMSSDQPLTQLAGVELFAALCESEMPGDGGAEDLGGEMPGEGAHSVLEPVPTQPATRDLGSSAPDPAVADPTMELEDPEEALAKVIAAAQGQGPASPEVTVEASKPVDPSGIKVDLGPDTNGKADQKPQPPAAPQPPKPPQPSQPPAPEPPIDEVPLVEEPAPAPPKPPTPKEDPKPKPAPEPKEEPKPKPPEPKKPVDTQPPKPSGPKSPSKPEPPRPGPVSAPPPPPQDDGCNCCTVM